MKETSFKKIAIIPVCHNTVQLIKVLGSFREKLVDEILINLDCAQPQDFDLIESAALRLQTPIHVLSRKDRKGVGYAIREGIDYALNKNYHVAVIMAGNGKDNPTEIPRLTQPIVSEQMDYVQGSRFLIGGKRVRNPFLRGMFSRLFPFAWTLATKTLCTDVTNGFRAYRLSLFKDRRINIWQSWLDGYQLEYYIHYKVLTLGFKVKEVPVSKTYPFRHKGGYSNISPFRDWWKIVSPLVYLKSGVKQ